MDTPAAAAAPTPAAAPAPEPPPPPPPPFAALFKSFGPAFLRAIFATNAAILTVLMLDYKIFTPPFSPPPRARGQARVPWVRRPGSPRPRPRDPRGPHKPPRGAGGTDRPSACTKATPPSTRERWPKQSVGSPLLRKTGFLSKSLTRLEETLTKWISNTSGPILNF